MIAWIKKIAGLSDSPDLKALHGRGAIIVDVRMPDEFSKGHIKDAINVPLPGLAKEITKLKKLNRPVITCCLSGARSLVAQKMMAQQGLEVYNGGGWKGLQSKISRQN